MIRASATLAARVALRAVVYPIAPRMMKEIQMGEVFRIEGSSAGLGLSNRQSGNFYFQFHLWI